MGRRVKEVEFRRQKYGAQGPLRDIYKNVHIRTELGRQFLNRYSKDVNVSHLRGVGH